MSPTQRGDALLFQERNHHSAESGIAPHVDDHGPGQYLGYFENQYGEQTVFVCDRVSSQAVLYLGDAGWQTTHAVVDGGVPDLVLSPTELSWLHACWQAATNRHQGAP